MPDSTVLFLKNDPRKAMQKLLFFSLLLVAVPALAQKVSVDIGPEIKIEKNLDFWGNVHSDSTGHYVMLMEQSQGLFSSGPSVPYFQKYDRKFKLVYSKELSADEDDVEFGNMFYAGGRFLFCTHIYNKKEKKLTLRATPIDKDGKISKAQKVAIVTYKEKKDKPTDIYWRISPDSSKLLVSTVADDDDNDLKAKVSLTVLDDKLNKIWSKGLSLPYTQERLTVKSWTVGNDGKVYMLGKVYDERNNKESKSKDGKRTPAYKMVIFRFNGDSTKPAEFKLDLKDKFVKDVAFKMNAVNDLNCAGFYANDTKGVIRGIFFTRINGETGEVEVSSKEELSKDDLAYFSVQKDKSGQEGLDADFVFNNIVSRADGGIVVTAEEAYHITTTHWTGRTYYTTTTYYNNEIFVASINGEGKFDWIRMISKNQVFNSPYFSGYMMMVKGNNLIFLYNDDIDNIGRPVTERAKRISSFGDAIASLVTIDGDGNVTRRKAFSAKEDADALMVPGPARQISDHELFFITTKFKLFGSKRLRMGVLKV
jgi:hypothetical protein